MLAMCIRLHATELYVIPATGPVIYDNYWPRNFEGKMLILTNEFGNDIFFTPTGSNRARTIGIIWIVFDMQSSATFSSATIRIRLYKNSSTNEDLTVPLSALFYDSGPVSGLRKGYNTLFLDGLTLTNVPDHIMWTVKVENVKSNELIGPLFYSPPKIGYAFNDYWEKVDGNWQPNQCSFFYVQLGAHFESSSLSAFPTNWISGDTLILTPATDAARIFNNEIDLKSFDTNRLAKFAHVYLDADSNNGRVDISPYPCALYPVGTSITNHAAPAPGCFFGSWDNGEPSAVLPLTLIEDTSISAIFGASPGGTLNIQHLGKNVILNWTGTAILQNARTAAGPWTDAEGVMNSSLTVSHTGSAMFYRLISGFRYYT